jgi:hypothetical protein
LKYSKRKKKKSFISLPSFWPVKPNNLPAQPTAHPSLAVRLLPRVCPSPAFPPITRLGQAQQAPMAQFGRALPPVSLRVADNMVPRVGRHLLLLHAASDFFPRFTDQILSSQSFLSLFRASTGYKNGMPHPSAPSYPKAKDRRRPEEATLEP